jgi:Transposase IS200 like
MVPSNCHRLDYPGDWSGLVEPVVSAENLDAPVPENFVSGLLACEGSVFPALAKSWWAFDGAFEESLPGQVEPISDSLDALRSHALPVRESRPSKLGEMGLQLGLGQPDAMFWLKGYSARILREKYATLQRMPSMWTRSFFVSTAGNVSSDTIQKYIAEQKTR